jgi:hypothetical protein
MNNLSKFKKGDQAFYVTVGNGTSCRPTFRATLVKIQSAGKKRGTATLWNTQGNLLVHLYPNSVLFESAAEVENYCFEQGPKEYALNVARVRRWAEGTSGISLVTDSFVQSQLALIAPEPGYEIVWKS